MQRNMLHWRPASGYLGASAKGDHILQIYPLYKFAEAIEVLATSSRRIQDRIRSATLSFVGVRDADFPTDEIRDAYRDFMETITMVKDDAVGHIPATLQQMSDEQAEEAAGKLFDVYRKLRAHAQPTH